MAFLKDYIRKRTLKKIQGNAETGFKCLDDIKTAAIVLDVEEKGFEDCKNAVLAFMKRHGIKADLHFLDFRKLEKDELLLTSIQTTYIRKDLNWLTDLPGMERLQKDFSQSTDMYISLVRKDIFTNRVISKMIPADFKIGVCDYPDNPYNIIASADDIGGCFKSICDILVKIQ